MLDNRTPSWLRTLERHFGWLAIPNIAVLLVTLQALGFLMVMVDPVWLTRLALFPDRVFAGEYWRLITFLALPMSMSPIWVIFVLWFQYFIVNAIESQWGSFKTTLYVLISIVVTIAFSLIFDYPVTQVTHFQSSLFFAAAALFPNMEITLFFVLPVKIKWLAWLTAAFLGLELLRESWLGRLHLVAIYSNYLVFFGQAHLASIRQLVRRKRFQRSLRD